MVDQLAGGWAFLSGWLEEELASIMFPSQHYYGLNLLRLDVSATRYSRDSLPWLHFFLDAVVDNICRMKWRGRRINSRLHTMRWGKVRLSLYLFSISGLYAQPFYNAADVSCEIQEKN